MEFRRNCDIITYVLQQIYKWLYTLYFTYDLGFIIIMLIIIWYRLMGEFFFDLYYLISIINYYYVSFMVWKHILCFIWWQKVLEDKDLKNKFNFNKWIKSFNVTIGKYISLPCNKRNNQKRKTRENTWTIMYTTFRQWLEIQYRLFV